MPSWLASSADRFWDSLMDWRPHSRNVPSVLPRRATPAKPSSPAAAALSCRSRGWMANPLVTARLGLSPANCADAWMLMSRVLLREAFAGDTKAPRNSVRLGQYPGRQLGDHHRSDERRAHGI